jgi:hypothetical protein
MYRTTPPKPPKPLLLPPKPPFPILPNGKIGNKKTPM